MRARVRLLKVTVQPEFVLDDGETLTPIPPQAIEVAGAKWAEFAADNFAQALAALQQQIDAIDPPRG